MLKRLSVLLGIAEPEELPDPPLLNDSADEYHHLVRHLEGSIRDENLRAARLMAISVIGGIGAIVWLYLISSWGLREIADAAGTSGVGNEGIYSITVYLLVRGAAYSAIVGGFLFGIFRLARSALDQATRFNKRLIALHFIRFAAGTERVPVEDLPKVVDVLSAWSATVDSAYTHQQDSDSQVSKVRVKWGDNEAEVTQGGKGDR